MSLSRKSQVSDQKILKITLVPTDSSTGYKQLRPVYRRVMHMVIHSPVCPSLMAFLV
jgi:hypothetical protein